MDPATVAHQPTELPGVAPLCLQAPMPWPVNPVLNSTLANMGMPAGFAWPQGLMQGIPGMALAMPGLTGALPTGTHVDLLSSLMAGTARTVSLHNNSTAAAKTDTDAITAQTQSGNPAPAVSGPAHMDLPTGITSQLEALLAAGLVGQQLSGLVQITPGLGDAQHTLAVSRHASTTMLNTLDSAPQAAIAASNNALSMLERIPNAGKAQPSGLGVQAATPAARAVLAADSPAGAIRTCTDIAEALNRAGSRPSSTSLAAQAEAAGAVEGGRGSRRAAGRPQRYSTSAANPANSGPNPCMPRPASMLALVEAAAAAAAAADGGTQTHTATAPAGTVRTTNSSMSTEQDEGESLSPLPSQTTGRMQRAESDADLKRLKRKQSNRESARRSRMKKQAEVDSLARGMMELRSENNVLRGALSTAHGLLERLAREKTALMAQVRDLGSEVPPDMDWQLPPKTEPMPTV